MNPSFLNNDSPVSPQKRPQDRSGPSRHSSSSLKEGDSPTNISKLFWGIIEFWLMVQAERSWPFKIVPAPSKVTKLEDNPEQNSTAKSEQNMNLCSDQTEEVPNPVPIDLPAESQARDVQDEQTYWNEMRLQLSRQRHQLYLWKVGSSDSDLDGLLESESDINRKLGRTILRAVVRISLAINSVVDSDKTGAQTHDSRKKLDKLMWNSYREYKFPQHEVMLVLDNPTGEWSPTEFLATIQTEIDILLNLRDHIKYYCKTKRLI
ncbi:hypothetical protein EV127DRAFT_514466 [Xylaria flabelliformis]|nr:hypothetical protein EV127DRAFT_514466 [Xylaria flabelliformis]